MTMSPIEKAQLTLKLVSGDGRMTERQAEKFVDFATAPFPPVFYPGVRGILTYPLYLYRRIRFKIYNATWEKTTGRQNPFRNGLTIKRMRNGIYENQNRIS